ncbi:MAG: hypothetical protein EOP04_31500 [Proteobacteria bacterium]|nr:MAG: hypothetical protein EOP04_31500 [Pseudomonadota bacterium]
MSSEIIIRAARPEDAKDIAHIHVDSWRSTYAGLVSQTYLDQLKYEDREKMWTSILHQITPRSHVLLAYDKDKKKVVGFVSSGPKQDHPEVKYDGEISALYILKEFHSFFYRQVQYIRLEAFDDLLNKYVGAEYYDFWCDPVRLAIDENWEEIRVSAKQVLAVLGKSHLGLKINISLLPSVPEANHVVQVIKNELIEKDK